MASLIWVFPILTLYLIQSAPTLSNSLLTHEELAKIPSNFLNLAKSTDFLDWMVGIRRTIHQNPEIGYQEFETSKLITSELDKLGIPYKYPVAVTGVVGYIGTGEPPFVAIRADMDALAMQESVEWEHKSKVPGKMHACGHDAHVTMLLGAAKLLQDYRDDIQGTVVLVFQPAEEGGGGAKKMLDSGVLKNVNAIFGLHVYPDTPMGTVSTRPGPFMAGSGFFEAVIHGKGGHAAIPQHTVDPIVTASSVVVSLQYLVSREADPLESQVVTVATFQGGGAFNVIPDSVTIGGTFRAFSKEGFIRLKHRIEEVIKAQSVVQRCTASVTFDSDEKPFYPVVVNDKPLYKFFQNVAGDLLDPKNVLEMQPMMESGSKRVIKAQSATQRCTASVTFDSDEKPFYPVVVNDKPLYKFFQNVAGDLLDPKNVLEMQPMMGAEDFAFFANAIPGFFYFLGMKNETRGKLEPLHSPYFTVNEDVLPYGAALHASLVMRYLLEHSAGDTLPKGSLRDEL